MKAVTKPSTPMQSSFFREEREEGAVFQVSLKKVRYRRSGNYLMGIEEDEEPVSHLQWETVLIRKIKAGTLKKLVYNLISEKDSLPEDMDPGYLMAFLSTYRAFAEVHDVLELVIERCLDTQQIRLENPEKSDRVMKSIIGVLMVWLEKFSSDFNDPPNFTDLKRLKSFVNGHMEGDMKKDLAKKSTEKLQTFIITPYESEGDPIGFRLSMLKDVDYIVEADRQSGSYEGLDFDFLLINPQLFAEQLTLMDAEVFRKVVPWHCLGSVWSNRRSRDKYNTVKPTVEQFNTVSYRVVSTILICSGKKSSAPSKRSKLITHWIDIAQECRDIKNFSSLKAIMSGLQSASIHRLNKSWMQVPRERQLLFSELASILSEDKNQKMSRELLMKEGTAKRPDSDMSGTKRGSSTKKRRSRFLNTESVMQGTVPYLGTFLTDLMMIDAAYPDYTEDRMINFYKRRKEFEIIAQIKLLQEVAKNYNIVPNENFRHTFDSLMTFSEAESFKISCDLEKESIKKRPVTFSLRRNQSDPDLASLSISPDLLQQQESKSSENSPVLPRHERNNSSGSSSSSSGICSGSEAPNAKGKHSPVKRMPSSPVVSNSWSSNRLSTSPLSTSSFGRRESGYIIRVSLDDDEDNGLVYKGVWLDQNERTPTVIQNCLIKHGLNSERSVDYCLVQQLRNGNELIFPGNCNVYYAVNSYAQPLTFQLRKRIT